jgi:hypothetical protein
MLSIIAAYIPVQKGNKAGINMVRSQHIHVMEVDALKANKPIPTGTCPRREAIKALSKLIESFQVKGHAIILSIDANRTPK